MHEHGVLVLYQQAIENKTCTRTHFEAKSLLCQHSHKGSSTRGNGALKAPVEGEGQVAHVGRHDVCKGWVVAGGPRPAAQAVHGHQATCIQGNTARFAILWKALYSHSALYLQTCCQDCDAAQKPFCDMTIQAGLQSGLVAGSIMR